MKFESKYAIFENLKFETFEGNNQLEGQIREVIASEVGPNEFAIFYTVQTPSGVQYAVDEISLIGELKKDPIC